MKKLLVLPLWLVFFSPLLIPGNSLSAQPCLDNDDCANAIILQGVISNTTYSCVDGCNLFAAPETTDNNCQIGIFPTVWYKVTTDSIADVINVIVTSSDFDQPVISMFKYITSCDDLEPVNITSGNMSCVVGTDGKVEALGNPALVNTTYYVAISSFNSIGGDFRLCISTNSKTSVCVQNRDISIVSRSNSGPLEGPFDPAETVRICMNVNQYTAAGNGCQWFQGIVPVFGNGWDPSSFDSLGQPFNATVNGFPTGQTSNGLYGTSTWTWRDSVDYHYDNSNMTIADLDGNGRLDMCNSKYEMDCPHTGVTGGCCGPCWGAPLGAMLPSGWFAYGINGTCSDPGPPIRVDWGDGNTCGSGMGPWQFCFDLVTRDVPDCMGDSTKRDLSLGFYTFADGEIGSWTGSASVCALDHPVKLSLQAKCGRIAMGNIEQLPPMCSNDTLRYLIDEPEVINWEWNISPYTAVPYLTNHGGNGFVLEAPLVNNNVDPVEVKGMLIGSYANSLDIIIRRFDFNVHNIETCPIVSVDDPKGAGGKIKNYIRIYPSPTNEDATLEWTFSLKRDAKIHIFNSQGKLMQEIPVSSHAGYQKQVDTQSLPTGVYLVSLSNNDVRYVTKLVKM